jgi:hypothetical protein
MRTLLTIADAAARLGISETEVRRRVKAGTLPAEQFERPQGVYYRVIFDVPDDPPTTQQEPPTTSQDVSNFTYTIDSLISTLSHSQLISEQRAERIAALERENGTLQAHNERLGELYQNACAATDKAEATNAALRAEVEALRVQAARPWWRRLL